jgi:hypothetical protein
MKRIKTGFTFFFLALSVLASAQFSKGDRMAGATVLNAFFSSGSADIEVASIGSNTSKVSGYNVSINPSLGWFIADNTVVGATLNINPYSQKTTYEQNGTTYQKDKDNGFNIGGGGFVRSYFGKSSSFLPFGQASLNAGISSLKESGFLYTGSGASAIKDTYDSKSSGGFFFNASFTAGLTRMVGDAAGLDFFIGYVYSYNKNTAKRTTLRDIGNDGSIDQRLENETTTKFTNHGLQVGIGFQVFLRGKGKK